MFTPEIRAIRSSLPNGDLALPLLVTWVGADHENPPVAADDLALFAHRFDRRSYLHGDSLSDSKTKNWILSSALATVAVAATGLKGRPTATGVWLRAHPGMLAAAQRRARAQNSAVLG